MGFASCSVLLLCGSFEELTGSHTQFYDKFTFRSLTAQLLEHLWTLRPYRESIIRYSQDSAK